MTEYEDIVTKKKKGHKESHNGYEMPVLFLCDYSCRFIFSTIILVHFL